MILRIRCVARLLSALRLTGLAHTHHFQTHHRYDKPACEAKSTEMDSDCVQQYFAYQGCAAEDNCDGAADFHRSPAPFARRHALGEHGKKDRPPDRISDHQIRDNGLHVILDS